MLGIIMLSPIISVNFSLLCESNTLNAKLKVGIPTQAKIYIATAFALSASGVLKSVAEITSEKIIKAIRIAKDYFFVSFRMYLMNSICML